MVLALALVVLCAIPFSVLGGVSWQGYQMIGIYDSDKTIIADYNSKFDHYQAPGHISKRNQAQDSLTPATPGELTATDAENTKGEPTWKDLGCSVEFSGEKVFTSRVHVQLTEEELKRAREPADKESKEIVSDYQFIQNKLDEAVERARVWLWENKKHEINIGTLVEGDTVGFGSSATSLESAASGTNGTTPRGTLYVNQYYVFFVFVVKPKASGIVRSFSFKSIPLNRSNSNLPAIQL